MKIIHTSDLHLNSPMTARLSADKVRDRKGELFTTFEKMVDEAVFQKASIFIIADTNVWMIGIMICPNGTKKCRIIFLKNHEKLLWIIWERNIVQMC